MSFEEPKAPIVRIRKKKVKKKSKDKEIVHLPVRASTQARYSSLTGPQEQPKGRECCRHMFACCLKIPICKTICFRCILPSCYKDVESDDENGKDEGYHSQNRGSSEAPPSFAAPGTSTQGAASTSDNAVEMTEIKTVEAVETVALIPPPRIINDYRKDPCSRQSSSSSSDAKGNQKTSEVTYIEVESVPVAKEVKLVEENAYVAKNIPDSDKMVDDIGKASGSDKEKSGGNDLNAKVQDRVVTNSDSPETDKKFVDIESDRQQNETEAVQEDSSEYVECDNVQGKMEYFNFDKMNMPKAEMMKSEEHDYVNDTHLNGANKVVDYANLDAIDTDSKSKEKEFDFTASEQPHDYMNLSELEKKTSDTQKESLRAQVSNLVKVTKGDTDKTSAKEENVEDHIEALKKQCLEVLESEFSDKDVSDHEDSKETNISEGKVNEADKTTENDSSESSVRETKVGLASAVDSSTEQESDKIHLVHVDENEKLVGKKSKKSKVKDNGLEASGDDSNGQNVTDQTKLL